MVRPITVSDTRTHRITVAIAYGSGPFSSHVVPTPRTFIWSPFGSPFCSPKWIPYGLHFSLMPDLCGLLNCFFSGKLEFFNRNLFFFSHNQFYSPSLWVSVLYSQTGTSDLKSRTSRLRPHVSDLTS